MLERPPQESVNRVAGRLRGEVRVGVQAVQDAQAGEAEVAEHVLGDQRRAQQQHEVRGDDRRPQHPSGQRARGEQHRHVARDHDQRERLEAIRGDAHAEALEGAGQPTRPAAAAGGHVQRGARRRAGGDQKDGAQHAQQPERAERAQSAHRYPSAGRLLYACPRSSGEENASCGGPSLYQRIVTSTRPARV